MYTVHKLHVNWRPCCVCQYAHAEPVYNNGVFHITNASTKARVRRLKLTLNSTTGRKYESASRCSCIETYLWLYKWRKWRKSVKTVRFSCAWSSTHTGRPWSPSNAWKFSLCVSKCNTSKQMPAARWLPKGSDVTSKDMPLQSMPTLLDHVY